MREKQGGCIGEAFRLKKTFDPRGRVVWVREAGPDGHAYFLASNGATLNLGDNGYVGLPNYTRGELKDLIKVGRAQYLRGRRVRET